MDIGLILDLMPIASTVGTVALAIWMWLNRGNKENAEDIDALEKLVEDKAGRDDVQDIRIKAADTERRLQAVETELKHLPGKNEVHSLTVGMTALQGEVKTLTEGQARLVSGLNRIEDYLLNGKKT